MNPDIKKSTLVNLGAVKMGDRINIKHLTFLSRGCRKHYQKQHTTALHRIIWKNTKGQMHLEFRNSFKGGEQ